MSHWVDLSHTLNNKTPVYPGTAPPDISPANTIEKDGFREYSLNIFNHIGTHIDCPAHILGNAKTLNDFNIEDFQGMACCIELDATTTANHIKNIFDKFHPEIILFRTGWDKYWGHDKYFTNFLVPNTAIIDVLIQYKPKAIGIDTISFDTLNAADLPNHHSLLANDIMLIENLCNLKQLPENLFQIFFFPLKLDNLDASPVRAVAKLNTL